MVLHWSMILNVRGSNPGKGENRCYLKTPSVHPAVNNTEGNQQVSFAWADLRSPSCTTETEDKHLPYRPWWPLSGIYL